MCFLLTFQLFQIIPLISSKSVSVFLMLELVSHVLVTFVPMSVPVAALFATIYTLGKLSDDSEIVAMRSFGMTKRQILIPFLLLGVLIGFAVYTLNKSVIPNSKARFKELTLSLSSKRVLSDVKPGTFYTEIPDIILFAEEVENEGTILRNLFIRQNTETQEKAIFAKRGSLIKKAKDELTTPSVRLHLTEGNVVTLDEDGSIEKVLFEEYDFPIVSDATEIKVVTKTSMRDSDQLWNLIQLRKKTLAKLEAKSNKDKTTINIIKRRKSGIAKAEIEYWTRVNTPLQTLMFIFLGVSLGIRKSRGVSGNSSVVGILVLLAYYIVFFLGIALAKKSVIPAYFVIPFPTVIVLIFAIKLYRKLDWAS